MARPTKHSKAMEKKALEYIENFKDHGDEIPSYGGMARVLKVGIQTLYDWVDQDRGQFPYIFALCMEEQKRTLLNNGLNGSFNSAIARLVLGKHGFQEKTATEVSGPGGAPIQHQEITFVPVGADD